MIQPDYGKILSPEKKKILILLKSFFDKHKSEFKSKKLSVQLVADSLQIGVATVKRVLADYQKDPKSVDNIAGGKGRPQRALNVGIQEKVRTFIRSTNMEGRHITLSTIRDFILQQPEQQTQKNDFTTMTLARTLDRWGFEFGKGTRTQHLKEKDYVIAARRRYLRRMINNRNNHSYEDTLRPEVYLDESYVNKNHSNDFVWYSVEDGPWIQKPTGNGERLIIMNAITKDGWVKNAKTVFKSSRKTGDYHGQMNGDIFKKWFTEKLIPNIPKNSLIIMDNASYHSVLSVNSAPIETSSKFLIRNWLDKNKISCSNDCLKTELVDILKKFAPEPTYEINEIATAHGHEILRTPPYHPELQPIEICWGVLKNEVARHCDFTMKNLEIQLEAAFTKVTKESCLKIISKIKVIEDEFWQDDATIDTINHGLIH